MTKYRVTLIPPLAKRMSANRRLYLILEDGWTGAVERDIPIKEGEYTVEFEVEPDIPYKYANISEMDTLTFDVRLLYWNSTGTRKQLIRLVPEIIR